MSVVMGTLLGVASRPDVSGDGNTAWSGQPA